jgi:hypothetical protein
MSQDQKTLSILFAQLSGSAILAVFVATQLFSPSPISTTNEPSQNTPTNTNILEVRPAVGDPEPLNTPLQSPKGKSDQKAAGSLQTPQKAETLQPNAGLSEFPQ